MSVSSGSSFAWSLTDEGIVISTANTTVCTVPSISTALVKSLNILRSAVMEEAQKFEKAAKEIEEIETSNNKFNEDRLKAEKVLLSTTLKREILLDNFKELHLSNDDVVCNIGSVTLSNISLHYGTNSRSNHFDEYFLCTLSVKEDCSLFLSKICRVSSDGNVNFNVNHTFTNLSVNFVISVKIYLLKIGRKSLTKQLWKKISNLFTSKEPPIQNNLGRQSLFKFCYGTKIAIQDVNETREVLLGLTNSRLRKMMIDVSAVVDASSFSHEGWMDVTRNGLYWDQRWCVLNGTQLSCFNYLTDATPVISVDLRFCTNARVVRFSEESGYRVIKLEMRSETCRFSTIFLRSTSKCEFDKWRILESLIPTLQCWRENGCLIV